MIPICFEQAKQAVERGTRDDRGIMLRGPLEVALETPVGDVDGAVVKD